MKTKKILLALYYSWAKLVRYWIAATALFVLYVFYNFIAQNFLLLGNGNFPKRIPIFYVAFLHILKLIYLLWLYSFSNDFVFHFVAFALTFAWLLKSCLYLIEVKVWCVNSVALFLILMFHIYNSMRSIGIPLFKILAGLSS